MQYWGMTLHHLLRNSLKEEKLYSILLNISSSTCDLSLIFVVYVNYSFSSCCWISLSRGGSNWLVSTNVNLTRRSDNGKINSSPISRSAAIVRFREGCPRSLRIPVEDPDGDVVKCRHSTFSESKFNDDSFPYGVLDEVNKFTVGFL